MRRVIQLKTKSKVMRQKINHLQDSMFVVCRCHEHRDHCVRNSYEWLINKFCVCKKLHLTLREKKRKEIQLP